MRTLRTTTLLAAAAALAACSDHSPLAEAPRTAAPLLSAASGHGIPGQYIVVLSEGADPRGVAAVAGVRPRFVYTAAVNGFAAALTAGQLNALRHHPAVEYVEQDQHGAIDITQTPAPTGLDRIDQRALPLDNSYSWSTTSFQTVYAYVLDTGLQADHPSFGGRAANVYDYDGGSGADCNGHGTHVAGIIGADVYGVARSARLRGLRVATCSGNSSASMITAGVDWVRLNHVKPAVANISISVARSTTLNTAVNNLAAAGVFTAVSAGNVADTACAYSPGSAASAVTVAASDPTNDQHATFSNYGSCVDLYAPGVNILSTWIGSTTSTQNGTSMASPHVAGVAALYKKTGDASTTTITNWIINNATAAAVQGEPPGTPDRLLFKSTL